MKRRDFLRLTAASALTACLQARAASSAGAPSGKRPNIVFILLDDMGYADLGCYGSPLCETPNIDRFAASGVRFTNAYAACPVCSPTRASIMTGQYPARLKLTNFLKGVRSPKDSPILTAPYADQLPLEAVTIAEVLREAGYATGEVGKWHLGGPEYAPVKQGFDFEFPGSFGGGVRSHFSQGPNGEEYLADRLTDEACRFIETHRGGPFFLYLSHYSVHIPLEAKPEKIAKYENKLRQHAAAPGQQHNALYAAMIESVDESVGRVLDTLERCGLADNTAVIFFSDNGGLSVEEGPNTPATTNAPLREGKGYLYEGGIREPLLVRWPGVTPSGKTCDTPVCSVDFFPTLCAMAGAQADTILDGVDISAALRNPAAPLAREALYWHYPHFANQGGRPGAAVRAGDWKLIEFYETGNVELYNLRDDIGEAHDLAAAKPDEAARLKQMLVQWRTAVDANMCPPNPEYKPPAP